MADSSHELKHLISDAPRVMVVDGSKLVRKLIADVLTRELPGVEVLGCSTIAEARAALESGPVHLVTTALALPDGDGMELARSVREAAGQAYVPVIVVSGDVQQNLVERRFTEYVTDYFDKSLGFQALATFIKGYVAPESEAGGEVDDETAFLLRVLLIHDYRRLLLRDPELPDVLLPTDWPGQKARLLCKELYRRLLAPSERHLDAHFQLASGQTPPASQLLHERFREDDPLAELPTEDVVGRTRWEMGALNMTPADWAAHQAVLEAHQPFRDLELQHRRADGSTTIGQDARLWASQLAPGSALDYPLTAGRLGYVQVISGRLAVNGVELSAGDGAKIAEESALHFMATDEAEILLFDLPPHQ